MNEAGGVGLLAHVGHYSACPPGGQSARLVALLLALVIALGGCIHPPRSHHPSVLAGPVVGVDAPLDTGAPPIDSPLGPLELGQAWVRRIDSGYRWHVEIANPSSSGFGATVVLRLLDTNGATTGSDSISLEIARGEKRALGGELAERPGGEPGDGGTQGLGPTTRWRLEVWVRVLPAPDRRTLRGTS